MSPTSCAGVPEAPTAGIGDQDEAAATVERYLLGLIRPEPRPYAARAGISQRNVRALLARLGDPQRRLRVVHIAGSKGKGSTALMLEALLQQGGVRTGTFTSPHLERWTERYRVGGEETSAVTLADVLSRLAPQVLAMAQAAADEPPSFFEVMTAAAFLLFAEQGVEVALVETGIGGRFDATNVIHPVVSVITSIEMEHVDKLGPALVDIARHKAGIIKPRVPLVTGRLPPAARQEIIATAERLCAPVSSLGRHFNVNTEDTADGCLTLDIRLAGGEYRVATSLRGQHLARNAALALATLEVGALLPAATLARSLTALTHLRLPARVEILAREPWLVVDGAHTFESARELGRALSSLGGGADGNRRVLLVSLSGEKSAASVLRPLLQTGTEVVLTRAEPLRSRDPEAVATELRDCGARVGITVIPRPEEALRHALSLLLADSVFCATGSMYMAGFARHALREHAALRAAA